MTIKKETPTEKPKAFSTSDKVAIAFRCQGEILNLFSDITDKEKESLALLVSDKGEMLTGGAEKFATWKSDFYADRKATTEE
jgi:hypothetical protein